MADLIFDKGWKRDDNTPPKQTTPAAFPDLPALPKKTAASRVPGNNPGEDDDTKGLSVNKGKEDKAEKGTEDKETKRKKSKNEKEEAGDEKIVVPKKVFKSVNEVVVKGLEEQEKKRKNNKGGCLYTIEFLEALSDALKCYNASDEDHTEFVTQFRKAWKQHHGLSVDMAQIVRETSTVDYQVLKDFHDAPGAASTNKVEKGSKDKVKKGKEKEEPEEAEKESKDKVKKGKNPKKEKEEPEEAAKESKDKVKKGKNPKKEEEEPEEAEKERKDKVKKGKNPKKEKEDPEETEKGSKGKVKKGKEPEKEKERIVIPETIVDKIKIILDDGLNEQHEKGVTGGQYTSIEFLIALRDTFEYYDATDADHTEFVICFHDAWKKKHAGSGNLAEILQRNSAVDYKELKHFHDAFWDATNDEPKFTDLAWKGATSTVTSVSTKKNVEPKMRMGTSRNKKSPRDEESDT